MGIRISGALLAAFLFLPSSAVAGSHGRVIRDCFRWFAPALVSNFRPFESAPKIVTRELKVDVREVAEIAAQRWVDLFIYRAVSESIGEYQLAREWNDLRIWASTADQRRLEEVLNSLLTHPSEEIVRRIRSFQEQIHDPKSDPRLAKASIKKSKWEIALDAPDPNGPPKSGESATKLADEVRGIFARVFGKTAYPTKFVEDVTDIVFGGKVLSDEDLHATNTGIAHYWSNEVQNDPVLFADALDFYSRVRRFDLLTDWKKPMGSISLFDPEVKIDAWNEALESSDGDPYRAIRVLSIFGHDDITQALPVIGKQSERAAALNAFLPRSLSIIYANGGLGGMKISPGLLKKFTEMHEEAKSLMERYKDGIFGLDAGPTPLNPMFRSGNYHFIGGMMVTAELVRRGHGNFAGLRLPVIVSEAAGWLYKRLTLESKYLGNNGRKIFNLGYPAKVVPRPAEMTEAEFEVAKYIVRLNLLHLDLTKEQHRAGAEWAWRKLRAKE